MSFGVATLQGDLFLLLWKQGENDLDPCGKIHVPIGIPDTLDVLKTFVETEGNFSPGFGSM
jgi:hypothetical protein